MNAIEMLIEQHRELEAGLKAALKAEPAQRQALFQKYADLLMSHVLIEERDFYPAVKAKRTEDILLESLEEHLSLKRLIADLLALPPEDQHFEPKLHVLKEQAEHHHKEEEEHLFPKVKTLLGADELESLGESMRAAQAELLRGEPRQLSTDQTSAAADL